MSAADVKKKNTHTYTHTEVLHRLGCEVSLAAVASQYFYIATVIGHPVLSAEYGAGKGSISLKMVSI